MHSGTKRVCLLTGASGTLGAAFCRLHADKYHIAAVYRSNPPAVPSQGQRFTDPLAPNASIPENSHPVFAIKADLGQSCELARVVELVLARFDRIDVLINVAVHSVWAPMLETNGLLESIDSQFHINATVPMKLAILVAQSFWRDRDQENVKLNRNVINVSSTAGLNVYPDLGQSVYGASKAALNHLTRHMADEFRPIGIRVNATAPTSFPSIVSTESVIQSILNLDEGTMTGKILIVDRDGERLV